MPLSLRRGVVTAIVERYPGLVRAEVDGVPCVVYPRLTGPVALGDDVIVNVQARELRLGSGGFDVLHVNLTRGLELAPEPGAHVMKLPYTSLQVTVPHAEEADGLSSELEGMPVVCCSLHSQLVLVCAGIGTGHRIAYVQLAGGALPVSLSDAVRVLRERSLLGVAIATGPCLDGDVACVDPASALAWAAGNGFHAAVCAIGPGIVGTGTALGHGGLAASVAANTAGALGGSPVVALRASSADARDRHRGLSHHARAVLRLCLADVAVAWPAGEPAPDGIDCHQIDVSGWERECSGVPLDHMGRGPQEDPLFFKAAFAAGRLARTLVR